MKKYFLLFIIIFSFGNCVKAQILFQKIYADQIPRHGDLTGDGGCIITGEDDNVNAYLLKTDSAGNVEWNKSYGGPEYDDANFVLQTNDGGYLLTGPIELTQSFYFGRLFLLKTNSNGDTLWTKYYEIAQGWHIEGMAADQTTDNGYIIIARSDDGSSGYQHLLRTDSLGNLLWNKINYSSYGGLNSVFQTSDGGFIGSGNGPFQCCVGIVLVKTDSAGNDIWARDFSPSNTNYWISGNALEKTPDGGFIIGGNYSGSPGGGFYLIKTNSAGDTLWSKAYLTGLFYSTGGATSIHKTFDGGYIVGGVSYLNGNHRYIVALKTDSFGNVTWMRKYGETLNDDWCYNIRQTTEGGYIIIGAHAYPGNPDSYAYLIKTDSNGVNGCNDSILNPTIYVPDIVLSSDSFFTASVTIATVTPAINVLSMNQQDTILCSSFVNIEHPETDEIKFFQNPFTISTTIDLGNVNSKYDFALYNELGQLTQSARHISGRYELKRGSLPAGIYFYRFSSKDNVFSGKVVIQ